MSPIVDSYSQPIDQLSPEPASYECQRDGNEAKHKRGQRWTPRFGPTEKPADNEQGRDNDVSHNPMLFARVPAGIAIQSTNPKTADSNPPMMPAAIIQNEIRNHSSAPLARLTMSNATAVANKPKGKTISIG